MVAAFLAAVFFALSAVFANRTTQLVGVAAANFARLWVAAGFLAAWAHGFGGGLHGGGVGVFVLSGMVGLGLGDLGLFAALPLLGSRLTALMVQCLAAPLAALLEFLWLGTTLRPTELLCIGAILGGVGLAVAPERRASGENPLRPLVDTAAHRRGVLFGCLAAAGQAGGAVISRKAHALSAASGYAVDGGTAAYQRILGGLLVVTAAYLLTRRRAASAAGTTGTTGAAPAWRRAAPWVVANSLAGAVLGVSCYQRALATTPSALVMPIVALTPLVVVPFAFFIEHERPSGRSLLGGVIAVGAAALLASHR